MKKITIFLTLIFSIHSFAQNVDFLKANFPENKDGMKTAVKHFKKGDEISMQGPFFFKEALPSYLEANKFNGNNAILNYRIGRAYLYSKYKLRSIPYLQKALKLAPNGNMKVHYFLGRAYQLNLEWDRALKEYNIYLKASTPAERSRLSPSLTKSMQECGTGKKLTKKPIRVFIDNAGPNVNTKYSDYGPVISADEAIMMFTSRRSTTTGGARDPSNNEFTEDIYICKNENGKWSPAINMGKPINTENHDANSGISPDGQKLLIYIGSNNGDMFESELKGNSWSKPKQMNKNINTAYHESSACYTPDGKSVYFVSDKEGGYGNRDIYISTKNKKGKWGDAVNLGSVINTKYGEEGIFAHPDGKTIYFSSQGHETMGGYDIFKSVFNDKTKTWGKPQNLGYPVNTPDDDVFFVISASGKHGYYSSFNAKGYGEKDIYRITFLGAEKPMAIDNEDNLLANRAAPVKEKVTVQTIAITEAKLTILKGVITDAVTGKVLEATIDIVDNEKNEVIATFTSNSATGKYLVTLPAGKNYGIAVKKENYLFHSENFDIPLTSAFQEIIKDVALKNVAVGSKIILNNIFFDTSKADLRKESHNELGRLHKLLIDVPTLEIEISGHTDSKGAADYNQKLSENRAKAVVDFLVKAGIATSRLKYKGYGKEQPIATNDTKEGRQMNRRTEFTITKN